mgnify:CR=1 FL=1
MKTGNHYVIEDNPNGDIFARLPDGKDRRLCDGRHYQDHRVQDPVPVSTLKRDHSRVTYLANKTCAPEQSARTSD